MPRRLIEDAWTTTRSRQIVWRGALLGLIPWRGIRSIHALDMALPLKAGLTPAEVAFLCEMEMVTVIPRQRLESLELLGVGQVRHHLVRSLY